MSYPRKLHILVIEDDSDAIEAYRASFKMLAKQFQFVEPVFARSFADAKKHIDSPEIFHVVLLDLNLPLATREQPIEGLAPGEQLLEELAKRDSHPIPVVLVISGKLNLSHSIGGLQDHLTQNFWYGRLVNKGLEQYQEIENGLTHALKYVDVGIHIVDGGKEWYPNLSPREQDLLRRCILSQPSSLGIDVRWWSAEQGPSVSHPSANRGPTKVLMGRFLMDDGMGTSLPTFFKFEPAGNGPFVCRDVGILSQKLGHVKVFHMANSRQRSLIVTQSVTNLGVPISLNDYLQGSPDIVAPNIPKLISQIVAQLSQLGQENEDEAPVSDFLWEHLDRAAVESIWNNCDIRQAIVEGVPTPLEAFDFLRATKAKLWASRINCIHGDLNATNVAIDASEPSNPQAYIFDAAGMRADFQFRDLAVLEVTTVLFDSPEIDDELMDTCRMAYEDGFMPNGVPDPHTAHAFAQNFFTMVSAIRSHFQSEEQKTAYALLVFDAAIRQLFGLGVQPSPNKVRNPLHACLLAAWVTKWLMNVAPDMFATLNVSGARAAPKQS